MFKAGTIHQVFRWATLTRGLLFDISLLLLIVTWLLLIVIRVRL